MRHIFKTKKELIQFYENKHLQEIRELKQKHAVEMEVRENTLDEVRKADIARERQKAKDKIQELTGEHRTEISEKESEFSAKLATLKKEHESALRSESNRLQIKIDEYDRKIKKQDDMNHKLSEKILIAESTCEELSTLESAGRAELDEMKTHYHNFSRRKSRADVLFESLMKGKSLNPHATLIKEETRHT